MEDKDYQKKNLEAIYSAASMAPVFKQNPKHCTGRFADSEAKQGTNHFDGTNRWHKSKHATRVFNTLNRVKILLFGNNNIYDHLSIELIPWHTPNSLTIGTYINSNLQMIFNNCLIFAANESHRINNHKLKDKVILRLNGAATQNLLIGLPCIPSN